MKRFFQQSYLSFKALFGWVDPASYLFVKIITPIFQLVFFCMLADFLYTGKDIAKYVAGNAIILCSYNCIFGVGNILREERYFGTLKNTVAALANTLSNFLNKIIIHIFDSLVTVFISLLAGIFIFNADFSAINIPAFILIILCGIFSAACMGLLLASFGLITDSMNLILNIISVMFLVFTGANYPIEKLPAMLKPVSYLLPLTRSIALTKKLLAGESLIRNLSLFFGEFIIGVIYLVLGYIILRYCEKIAIKKGSLDIF